jgi:hypothetical protein
MKAQYLTHTARSYTVESLPKLPSNLFKIEKQMPDNLDIIPGYLDLPSGTLDAHNVRRFLNVSALFSDHLIIPDGWHRLYIRDLERRQLEKLQG